MTEDILLITSGNGVLYSYNINDKSLTPVYATPNDNEYLMGISKYDDIVVVSTGVAILEMSRESENSWKCISSLSEDREDVYYGFQHMSVIGSYIFIASKRFNSIIVVDFGFLDNSAPDIIAIISPRAKTQNTNFDGINSICYHNGNYLINKYHIDNIPSKSGITVFNNESKISEKYIYGWNTHGLSVIDEDRWILCNHVNDIDFNTGLLVENTMRIVCPNNYYCSDIAVNDDLIFIVGHAVIDREDTNDSGGMILVYDRKFNYLYSTLFKGTGRFKGCMLLNEDITNNSWRVNDEDIGVGDWETYYDKEIAFRFPV